MIRLFVALEIPKETLSFILNERDKVIFQEKNIRWEAVEKLHVTIKFLGDTNEKILERIYEELQTITNRYKVFRLEVNRFGVFRKGSDPKILWVGFKENKLLTSFVNDIEESFCNFGFKKEERKFKPHITLLRFKGNENIEEILKLLDVKIPFHKFEANKISLIKSELKPSGSVYSTLKSFIIEN